ncbi:alkaline phosphatase-like protein [Acephala macrosclerotiorum]|nr:alkaline phosphatase-like protein [Acephala macrosclerotiorum]
MSTDTAKPNVVLILADNLGWGELGCYGGILRSAATPRNDALAKEGLLLHNFSVESDCVPTRSALIAGRYFIRIGCLQSVPAGMPQGLTPWEETLPEVLQKSGHTNAHFGKWHLGDVLSRFPSDQGFDEWYGILDKLKQRIHCSCIILSLRTRWRRWIIELDNFSIISTLGIRDNTVLIFASDCGPEFRPPYRGIDAPWTGTYHTAMKGSLRAPFVTRWPGHVPFNVTSNKIVRVTDIFGTILGVTGTALPNGRPIDGIDQTSFFKDPSNSKPNRKGKGKLESPYLFNAVRDPKEETDVLAFNTWTLQLILKMQAELFKSLKKDPASKNGLEEAFWG